ncbi:glucokinase [Arthrobacter globiformis]|uniref:ROK family protein n=1 Tax=Arthrobacter globiformis TaxID=1665 RepID=UPI0027867678|nr:ROK family protein [Arthrobacter globiformis]MDQ1060841.1 glucokinase [Arthrobacter globiformis]
MPATAPDPTGDPAGLVVGVDIGGTGTRFVAMDLERKILARHAVPTPARFTSGSATDFLAGQINFLVQGEPIAAIGIGASGPVDSEGIIRNPDTLPAFTGEPVVSELTTRFKTRVRIDNDAVCAALAEQRVGAAAGSASLLHITLGTGIGSCLLLDGRPLRGADGMHPEAGHITVRHAPVACYCGRDACWEQAASRQALQRAAAAVLGRDPDDRNAVADLAENATRGDAAATRMFREYGLAVAVGLGTLLAAYRPNTVILGGSAAEHLNLYREEIQSYLAGLGPWIHHARLAATHLDDFGGAIGAAHLTLANI